MTPAERRVAAVVVSEWILRLLAVPQIHQARGIVEHDRVDDEEGAPLFPELLVVGIALPQPVLSNLMAFRGADIRAFKPVWDAIVKDLGLTDRDRRNPVGGGFGTIVENRARLEAIKRRLDAKSAPAVAKKSSNVGLLVAALAGGTLLALLLAARKGTGDDGDSA